MSTSTVLTRSFAKKVLNSETTREKTMTTEIIVTEKEHCRSVVRTETRDNNLNRKGEKRERKRERQRERQRKREKIERKKEREREK